MDYKTGDILKAETLNFPFIHHYGIVVVTKKGVNVVHNTPNRKNKYGGNIIVDDINFWLKTRKIIQVQRTNITQKRIKEVIEKYKTRKYKLITFNCEHFISEVKSGTPSSPELRKIIINLATFLFIITIIWRKLSSV